MSDLINRQDAIDAICGNCTMAKAGGRCTDDFCPDIRALKEMPSAHHLENIKAYAHDMGVSLEQAERELTVQETHAETHKNARVCLGEWIPCSERLPEKEGQYLCTVGALYRNPREMIYVPDQWVCNDDANKWKCIDGSRVFNNFVEAWMPLPEPYTED